MKYKKIMLIALLLLAVLTISAVSASDDAALDNVTASDDVDVIVSDPDDSGDDSGDGTEEDEYGAWFNESEIDIGGGYDENVVVASMTVPNTTAAGSFVISNDNERLFEAPIVGGDAWKTDEKTKGLVCEVLLGNLSTQFGKIKDGDVIYFDFYDGEGNITEEYCAQALYKFNDTSLTIQLVDIEIYVYADEVNDFNLSDDDDLNEPFAFILAPSEIKGNFTIYAGEDDDIRYYFNKNLTGMVRSLDDETGLMRYSVSLKNLTNLDNFAKEENFTIALLSLDVNYEWECADYEIYNDDGIISFTEIGEDDEVDFDIEDIDTTNPDEAFVTVSVAERKGYFKILLESGPEPMTLFSENLNTTTRPYELDEDGWYCFNFTYADVNKYIKENIDDADDFTDVVDDGDMVVFAVEYDDAEPYSEEYNAFIKPDGMIVFDPVEDEDEDVYAYYGELDVIKYDGWKDDPFMVFQIINDFSGKIVIKLDDDEVFNKAVSDLQGTPDDEDPNFNNYVITFNNLTSDFKEDTYLISWWVYEDDDEDPVEQYDDEEPEFLRLHDAQIVNNENTTIIIIPTDVIIGYDDAIIIINTTKTEGNVVITVDDNETPITVPLSDCTPSPEGYLIGAKQLSLKEGIHTLNVTYDGLNLTGHVCLFSNVRIFLPEDDEIIYTGSGLNASFIHFRLEEDEIEGNVNGTVNATIYDGETIIATIQKDIKDLYYHDGPRAYVISVNDFKLDYDLSGSYWVLVKYFNGNESDTMNGAIVAFKKLAADDFEFTATEGGIIISKCPLEHGVLNVTIDGVSTIYDLEDVEWDEDGETGFLEIDELDNKTHKVSIAYKVDKDSTESLDVDDVVTNPVDPSLTISVANITEGNPAVVTITTNATFSGNVIVTIANKNYTVSVVNGKGTINVAGLAANNYNATAIFAATGIFAYSQKTVSFTVAKKPVTPAKKADKIKLTLKKVKVKKSAKKLVLRATLKINGKAVKGKKITFKFKGKKYKAKTNKKGVAKVTIKKKVLKKLKVGKKVKYQATYGKVTKKYTVKVKK